MKRLFVFLAAVSMALLPMMAQEIDETFVFVDENEDIIENGATVVRNVVETDHDGNEVIYSGISVADMGAPSDVFLKMKYVINQIDNGTYQICFPMTCNMQTTTGTFETAPGQVNGDVQDIQSEWFPQADGECVVTLTIDVLTKVSAFPPKYEHLAYGPTITLKFVKGGAPEPLQGDVNGDNEVNVADVNAVIDIILSSSGNMAGDVTGDNEVNIADVNAVIDIILNN